MDNVGIVSAGVAYFIFLAIVPLLGAVVLSYGLIVDTQTVTRHIQALAEMAPGPGTQLISGQLEAVVQSSSGKKGIGLAIALGIALFGARKAANSVVIALNIAFNCEEKRGFFHSNLLALGMTVCGILGAGIAMTATTLLSALTSMVPDISGSSAFLGKSVSYGVLLLAGIIGASALYRFGPAGDRSTARWFTPGALLAAIGWMILTNGFGYYVSNFGNYNATYGSLGAVIVLLTWLYFSAYVLLFGAELDAVLESPEHGRS
ncbi:YihY/virulence factor BrkB family protein [Altericroceibacterium spongiae]|uniref:YihY/virulence factor BrkB family protein n=2 Tax=Altericroceibacterium spongiae TaxID=2320269 RepID=A0A420EEM8_9SPHN|nr:YihY/virulence factor BrkB family protein [Altericroceibacterium spongiae]